MEKIQIISVAVIALITAIFIAWKIKKKGLRQTAIDLIVLAEKHFGAEQGREKMAEVVIGLLTKLGCPKTAIAYAIIERFAQAVFDEVKVALDYKPEIKGE